MSSRSWRGFLGSLWVWRHRPLFLPASRSLPAGEEGAQDA